jgi:PiT family inorganic phosphate transporter
MPEAWIWALIGLALVFDFLNGVHDAANSIATVVSTRVLSPRLAVVWAAFFNFIAFLVFDLRVAATIGKGTVDPAQVTLVVVAAGLTGAIAWNLITWYWGLPSSSSHALVGGLAGAALAHAGPGALVAPGLIKISIFIFVAPLFGMVLGYLVMVATLWIFRRASPSRVSKLFRHLQLLSAAAYSLGHGGNDAQKTMGVIYMILVTSERLSSSDRIPLWVVLACHTAMGLGTLLGGWRIVRTMGQRIAKLQPVHGFAAESAGSTALYLATGMGIPVSTTHTIAGCIAGVGATRGLRTVRWSVATRVLWAWVFTIPASAAVGASTFALFSLVT